MKKYLQTRSAKLTAGTAMVAAFIIGTVAMAGAASYDPTSALTGLANSAASTASPILIGVTVALIPLFIVFLIVGWVKGLFGRRYR